jgi:hypothetical protein
LSQDPKNIGEFLELSLPVPFDVLEEAGNGFHRRVHFTPRCTDFVCKREK